MLAQLEGYDWAEAFGYAGEANTNGSANVSPVPDAKCSAAPFTREDVVEIIGMVEGENDGPDWVVAGLLRDGRWFCLHAGCDYTGWGCQAGGSAAVADDRESLIRLGIGADERGRLGLEIAP